MDPFAAWCVPELSLEADARLRMQELELQQAVHECPESVAALTAGLLRQNALYRSSMDKACRHIQELQIRLALMEPRQELSDAARKIEADLCG
jgi:hypothetical protein